MASKTAYQFFHDEQIKLTKNKTGKSSSELQKDIGNKWNNMSQKEKQPYLNKKKEYEEQLKREQEVLKSFQKKQSNTNSNSNVVKNTRSSNNSQVTPLSSSRSPAPQQSQQATNPKFLKENLQKQGVDASKKVVVQQQPIKSSQPLQKQSQNSQVSAKGGSQQPQKSSQQQQPTARNNSLEKKEDEETSHKVYLEFYSQQFQKYRKVYPQREGKELTKVISQEWKLMQLSHKLKQKQSKDHVKSQKKQQGVAGSKKGFVIINGVQVQVPKKPLPGYMRYYIANYDKIKTENPELGPNQIAVQASENWQKMSESDKSEFNDPYIQERIVFQEKKTEFISKYGFFPSGNVTSKQSKNTEKNAQKDNQKSMKQLAANLNEESNAIPKKNSVLVRGKWIPGPVKQSGYNLFDKTLREQLKDKEHTLSARQISAFIGKQWKEFPAEDKKAYEARQTQLFELEKAAFIAKHGQYTVPERKVTGAAAKSLQEFQARNTAATVQTKNSAAEQQQQGKNLNVKRSFQQSSSSNNNAKPQIIVSKPQLSLEEREELLANRVQRKNKINYDNVDSEMEDMEDCLSEDEVKQTNNNRKVNNQEQEQFERRFIKKFKPNEEKPSVNKSRNPLRDLLNEPIELPEQQINPYFSNMYF